MGKFLKLVKALLNQGFASAAQKAEAAALFATFDDETKGELSAELAKVNALAESKVGAEDEMEKSIRSLIGQAVEAKTSEKVEVAVKGIKDEIKAWAETQMKAIEAKAGNYHPDVKAKRAGLNAYLRSLTQAVLGNDLEALKTLHKVTSTKELTTDATGTPFGGYVVDRELSAEIRLMTTEYGVARKEFMAVQLTKGSYSANALATDVTVFWVDQAASIGSTQAVLGQESLELKKLGAIVTLTRELLEDSEIDLFAFIGARVAEGFAMFEDRAFFMGTGASDTTNGEFTGIMVSAGNTVTIPVRGSKSGEAFSDITTDDLAAMQDASPQWVARNGKYYMHRSIRNLVRVMKDANGAPIYQSPSENGPATILGRPVVEVEVLPTTGDTAADTAFVLYADLRKSSILGYKGAMSADRFNAGIVRNVANNADVNLITSDREAVRWIERVGAITILPKAATVLKTGTGS